MRQRLRDVIARLVSRDDTPQEQLDTGVWCPCCLQTSPAYRPLPNTPNGVCEVCGSYHRHRLLLLFLQRETDVATRRRPLRVLHVAPEDTIAAWLRGLPHVCYVSTDRCSPGYDYPPGLPAVRSDVLALPFPDESFDVVLCNHVFEHVADDSAAMREIHRVLRADGWAILMVPLTENPETFEDLSVTEPEERIQLFGQFDHVRLYGKDYPKRLARAGFAVSMIDYAGRFDARETHRLGLLQGFDDTIVRCRRRPVTSA